MAERAVTLMKQQQMLLLANRPVVLDEHPDPHLLIPMHRQLHTQQHHLLHSFDRLQFTKKLNKLKEYKKKVGKEDSKLSRSLQLAIDKMEREGATALQRAERQREIAVKKRFNELTDRKLLKRRRIERAQRLMEQAIMRESQLDGTSNSNNNNNEDQLDDDQQLSEHERLYRHMVRKQIPKAAKQMSSSLQARLANAKKAAILSAKEAKRSEARELKALKEASNRGKRLMREQLAFWKKNEREERELRKKAEKEAAERRRQEEEQREARRQAKKLNFLITQTELYSHFIARKSSMPSTATTAPTSKSPLLSVDTDFADIDDEDLRREAERKAMQAAKSHHQRITNFDSNSNNNNNAMLDSLNFQTPTLLEGAVVDVLQPDLLSCQLKGYQLKGLTWLANLYEQGINGILADEMGLGKTVQSISLMAHLAERHNIWGPFLVISPASTLHNWQQEVAKFVPSFKILPYWGSVKDRATLRKFWNPKHLGHRDSPFHVLITSYQLIVSDEKHFQRLKWQYMILDEAQAIKSSTSIRWKTLLSFDCRNRLLLTGTPIQNSMQELWALLHFIMPGLFDSHDEFSDWFSKDIESAAQQQAKTSNTGNNSNNSNSTAGTGFNEHQLHRLHMILKPFMLRRVKKDVESELGDKIEVDVVCEMSAKQRLLYAGIKEKVPVAELLERANRLDDSSTADTSLMNLVMQFRKVCNHPELFERTELTSPWVMHAVGKISPDHRHDGNGGGVWMGALANPIDVRVPHNLLELDEPQSRLFICKRDKYDHIMYCQATPDIPQQLLLFDGHHHRQQAVPMVYAHPVLARPIIESGLAIPTDNAMPEDLSASIRVPSMRKMIMESGKLRQLDHLLADLHRNGHRVLIYNQMTRMIDIMEEYLQYRHYTYLRLDGSCRIADRRDLVHDWQTRPDIFIFVLSTRAGGLGINLTAADTVIFYDSDWNPTVDQQAMDRAHRLGQTKQVTVYRMVTKASIEERILERAKEKDAIHKMVIAGGEFKPEAVASNPGGKMRDRDLAMLLLDG